MDSGYLANGIIQIIQGEIELSVIENLARNSLVNENIS